MALQVAGDANVAGQVYPDQSLYPCNSVPALVERINNALQRADQIEHAEGNVKVLLLAPQTGALNQTTFSEVMFSKALDHATGDSGGVFTGISSLSRCRARDTVALIA